ncbi:MAG TPA: SAM-dependent chlorinase/fluorinase [Stellaceae bacterium]|nr:SAM-dependent chlorinase/fluorinase [Stellaceae bacterium]
MIALFTDFGLAGPYTGQVKAVLARQAPGVPVVDLFADLPAGDPQSAAYLLAAYAGWFAPPIVLLAVVDPGVGSMRRGIVIEAEGRFYVGPENGLFELVLRRAAGVRAWEIVWRPELLSASFHGRDLFAPVAARLSLVGPESTMLRATEVARMRDWPDDWPAVVYIDHFGNAMTGLRAASIPPTARLAAGARVLHRAGTFSDVPAGEAFWYENSNGLVEIAVNSGRADAVLGLGLGSPVVLMA